MIDALDRIGGNAKAHVAAERIRDEGHVAQVRQEAPLGLDIRVAHLVAHLRALGGQFTAPRHRDKSSSIPAPVRVMRRRSQGSKTRPTREPGTYRGRQPGRQGLGRREKP